MPEREGNLSIIVMLPVIVFFRQFLPAWQVMSRKEKR
jgi:hypothetical protein